MQTVDTGLVLKTLEDLPELVDNLLLLLSDKEKTVIKKRFALTGKNRQTLEQIGRDFSVTRERVRQIEKNALAKMRRNVFNTSLKELHEYFAGIVKDHGGLLRRDTLVENLHTTFPANLKLADGPLDLSLVLHEGLEYVGNTINFYPHVRDSELPEYSLKHVSNNLINQLQKYGDAKKMDRISSDLRNLFSDLDFDLVRLKSLIDIDKRITLLDDDSVALLEWRHIHPRTLRDKILFILRNEKKPMHFTDIAERIFSANFDNRNVNLQAVHNELIRHDNFVLIGRGIYALTEWGYESGTVAEVVESILKDSGELSQEEIVAKVLEKRQVKKITIVLALKNGKKFTRIGRRRYKLKA